MSDPKQTAYHTLFELLDAHERGDRLLVVECFESLAAAGASGQVSGLLVRVYTAPEGTAEKLLAIFAQFAKAVSDEVQQLQVINVLRTL